MDDVVVDGLEKSANGGGWSEVLDGDDEIGGGKRVESERGSVLGGEAIKLGRFGGEGSGKEADVAGLGKAG